MLYEYLDKENALLKNSLVSEKSNSIHYINMVFKQCEHILAKTNFLRKYKDVWIESVAVWQHV